MRYITRPSAEAYVLAARMPADRNQARAWLHEQELSSRKNERMIDKIMGALPRELSEEQQNQLVRDYAEKMTQGRAPWFAAIHRTRKDADNPHMHLVIRDRDPETGKKVAQLSSNKSTERVRLAWEQDVNQALEKAGREERVDRRSLKDQGIDREPTVHIGPKAKGMDRKGHEPKHPAPIAHEPVGTAREKARKLQRMRDYRETTRIAYNARLQAQLSRKHVLETARLKEVQNEQNAAQKTVYAQDQQKAAQRLEAKGFRRVLRDLFGKTREDKEALARSRQSLGEIEKRESAEQAALARKQSEERAVQERQAQNWLAKERDRVFQQPKEQQNAQLLEPEFKKSAEDRRQEMLRERKEARAERDADRIRVARERGAPDRGYER